MYQYERFSQFLKEAVDRTGLHNNEMIRSLGIDRSSYYQFLKGTRLPTKEQYQALKHFMLLPKEEIMQLDDVYFRSVLGENTWEDILNVREFVKMLSKASYPSGLGSENLISDIPETGGKNDRSTDRQTVRFLRGQKEVEAGIEEVLHEALQEKKLDYHMPVSADTFYILLRKLAVRAGKDMEVRQLAGLQGGRIADRKEAAGIFRGLLGFLSSRPDIYPECRYYYNAAGKISDSGLLYPWYIISGNIVLMISSDFCSGVFSCDEELAKAFSEQFGKAFSESVPLMKKYGALEQNLRAVREFLQGKKEVNYEAIPCTAMIATPQMIRKYVIPQAQEALIQHCEALQKDETMIDISSITGLKKFIETKRIPEIPEAFMRPVETEDLIWYMDNVLERLGSTLFIIDESRIPPVYDWDITIIEGYSVLIHQHNFDTIIVDEKNIVDIFTSFAQNISETPFVMDMEKARKELLDIRSELVLQLQQ